MKIWFLSKELHAFLRMIERLTTGEKVLFFRLELSTRCRSSAAFFTEKRVVPSPLVWKTVLMTDGLMIMLTL